MPQGRYAPADVLEPPAETTAAPQGRFKLADLQSSAAPALKPPVSLSVGGVPYVTGNFTEQDLDVIGRSPAAQAITTPTYKPPPPPSPSYVAPPERLGSAKTGGGATEPAFGEGILDTPAEGVAQLARGTTALAKQIAHPPIVAPEAHVLAPSRPGEDAAAFDAASDVLEGAMKVGSPLLIAGALADLPGTIVGLGTAYAASAAAGKATAAAGASPELQRFSRALAGAATSVVGAKEIAESAAKGVSSSARALALSAKLAGSVVGEARPVGAGTVAEATVQPGVHAPLAAIDSGAPSSVELPAGSGPAETLADIVRTALAPEPPELQTEVGAPRTPENKAAYQAAVNAATSKGQTPPTWVEFLKSKGVAEAQGPYAATDVAKVEPPEEAPRPVAAVTSSEPTAEIAPETAAPAPTDVTSSTPPASTLPPVRPGESVSAYQRRARIGFTAAKAAVDAAASAEGAKPEDSGVPRGIPEVPATTEATKDTEVAPRSTSLPSRAAMAAEEEPPTKAPKPIDVLAVQRAWAKLERPPQTDTALDAAVPPGQPQSFYRALLTRYGNLAASARAKVRQAGANKADAGRWGRVADAWDATVARAKLHFENATSPDATASAPADILDTGEAQPRLPGDVGAARDTRAETPALAEVPFSLTREAATSTPAQPTLREEAGAPASPGPLEWDAVAPPVRRELRRIVTEMEALPYEGKTFTETTRRGGDFEVRGGVAGAPVYWDIVGGNPDGGRPTISGSRAEVTAKLHNFIDRGKRSTISDHAIDVAERRLAGDRTLSKPSLPPSAGDSNAVDVVRLSGLSRGQTAVQTRVARAVEADPDKYVARYIRQNGNLVNADLAKELFPEYAANNAARTANARAVHTASQAIAEAAYRQLVTAPTPEGKDPIVVFTAGGTGSGKSSSLEQAYAPLVDAAQVVFDSTLSDRDRAIRNVDLALANGKDAVIVFVIRHADRAFADGVLPRAMKHGRPVTIERHIATHLGALQVFHELRKHYASDEHVSFWAVDNTGAAGEAGAAALEDVDKLRYDEEDVRRHLLRVAAGQRKSGRISARVHEAVVGRRAAVDADVAGKGARQEQVDRPTGEVVPPRTSDGEPEALEIEESGARGPRAPIAQVALVPGAGAFAQRDLVPALAAASREVTEAHSAIRALWAPARVSESAETFAAIMRPNLALRRQRDAMARRAMRKLEVAWDKMPRAAQLAFAMAIDEGRIDDLPADQRALAELLKSVNDQKRREANALGGKVGYIEHYYPREWVRPGKVREFVMRALFGKRPLQGRAGFKKARARDKESGEVFSFRELHKAGFEPVSYNPVTAHLRKWLEMDKWIAARRILLEGKAAGVATFVPVGEKPPEGETRYAESFGTVYGPPTVEVKEAYDAGLMEALHRFASEQGITMVRRLNLGGRKWGYHVRKGARSEIHSRFGGPEGVLMHEIGHALDHSHGLGEKIGLAQASERQEEINFSETPTKVLKELRALADLRLEKTSSKSYRQYVRNRAEVIANLVHGFLYAPDLTKQVAPNAYWAVHNLAKDTPSLHGLLDIQKARSLRFGVNVAQARIQGMVIKGYYYGPPDAVRLLDNYLSPGLRGNLAFNLYRAAGNLLNQVQLGLSVFHVLTTATNSTISRGALALEQFSRGHVGEAAKSAALTATLVGPPLLDVVRGHRYLREFYAKDAQFRDLVNTADIVAKAGGGVGWDTFWHESGPERFLQSFRSTIAEAKVGNYPGALVRAGYTGWRAVPAAIELLAKPVMEWWVPRLKLAAFMDLARLELQDLGAKPDSLEAAKVLGRAWDSIDNRFGELIYDNIFWHAILKDAGMASVRALGWNLGTVREVFGALPAQAAQFGLLPNAGSGGGLGKPPQRLRHVGFTEDAETGASIPLYARGRAPWLTHQFAYFLALLYTAAVMGAIYQYLHTGKKPGEQEDGSIDASTLLLDLYFPRTGATKQDGGPERATLWTYMKDVFAFLRHPIDTAAGKAHPALSLAWDLIRNEDYFGNAMRNGDDPVVQQLEDMFSFIGEQYKPISVKNFEQRKGAHGETGIGPFESFLGVNVAPAKVTRTAAEDYLHSVGPPTHRTKEEAAHSSAVRDLRSARQTGDVAGAQAAIEEGNLSRRSVLLSAKAARLTVLQRSFQPTTLPQALKAYELGTPEERRDLQPLLVRKWHNLFKEVAPAQKTAVYDRFMAAMNLPTEARPAAAAAR